VSESLQAQRGSGTADRALADLVAEITDRLHASQPVSLADYVERYPEFAERLQTLLPSLELLHSLGSSTGADSAPGRDAEPHPGTLGDFRILREIGRGGMGVVYEAEQVSLNRRVALKVLPLAGAMDSRQLQRFKIEAQAAAQLHHTNIVPVHYVGCERGVHFYAMQFIEGESLAAVIAALKNTHHKVTKDTEETQAYAPPSLCPPCLCGESSGSPPSTAVALTTDYSSKPHEYYRRVAELGIQAAEALDFAHEHGVIHRDVKPANLLVEAGTPLAPVGERGGGEGVRLWVTDFGLAQVQGDARMTMTGDLVGTLRYMSPEQALAKRVVVDHRTDVYSLGATLYELLTLEPAFAGTDRQELLRQIAFEEPRPPRRVKRTIPAELETIVLKALEKNPADRYATAKEMAEDLRRFVMDEPIRAKRPGMVQRLRKWGRRHRAGVTAAALCLFVVAMLAGINGVWWLQKRASAHVEARAAIDEATRLLGQERWIEGLSAARRAQAILAGVWADPSLRQQADVLAKDLEMAHHLEEAQLLEAALKSGDYDTGATTAAYAESFEWYGLDPAKLDPQEIGEFVRSRSIDAQLIAALDHWAAITRNPSLGRKLQEAALRADPRPLRFHLSNFAKERDPKVLEALIASLRIDEIRPATAHLIAGIARHTPAAEQAATLLRQVQQRHPNDFWVNHELGRCLHDLHPPRLNEAICYYTASVALRPLSPGARLQFGACLFDSGRFGDAIFQYLRAIELQPDYAEAHNNLGQALWGQGNRAEAVAAWRKAIELKPNLPHPLVNLSRALLKQRELEEAQAVLRRLIVLMPDSAEPQNNLGNALNAQGNLLEAEAAYRKAIDLEPNLAEAHYNLGGVLSEQRKPAEAEVAYRKAIQLKPEIASFHHNLGHALFDQGKLAEAEEAFRKAIALKPDDALAHCGLGKALEDQGRLKEAIPEYRKAIKIEKSFADAHNNLGNALRQQGQLDEAIAEYLEAIHINKDFAFAHNNLGVALRENGQLDEALTEFREAIRLKKDYPEAHCNLGFALMEQGQFVEALSFVKLGHELESRNPGRRTKSAQLLEMCQHFVELDRKLPVILSGKQKPANVAERIALAEMCQLPCKRVYAAAVRFYQSAFLAVPNLTENLNSSHRYNAACAAALAGCGQGKDADQTDDKERARLRRQALDWLHADLAAYCHLLDKEPDKARPVVMQRRQHWQHDTDFIGVRGPEALAKLPEDERKDWQSLWEEVESLRKRAAGSAETGPAAPELVPAPMEADARDEMSFDCIHRPARIAGDEPFPAAIDEQVQVFQDDRADQGGLALGLHDGRKRVAAAQEFDVYVFRLAALRLATIGISDLNGTTRGQAESLHDGFRQDQLGRAWIDHPGNRLAPHLVLGQRAFFGLDDVANVGNLELDAESTHAVGSFAVHGRPPRPSERVTSGL